MTSIHGGILPSCKAIRLLCFFRRAASPGIYHYGREAEEFCCRDLCSEVVEPSVFTRAIIGEVCEGGIFLARKPSFSPTVL